MMDTRVEPGNGWDTLDIPPVGGPASKGWQEGTLTRAEELEALSRFWVRPRGPQNNDEVLTKAICRHLEAARQAAVGAPLDPPRRFQFRIFRHRKAAKQEARGVRTRDRDQRRLASIEDFYVLLQNRASDPKAQWHAEAVDLIDKLKARGMWPEDAELLTRHGVLAAPPDTPMDSSRRFQIRIFCYGRYGSRIERARSNLDAAEAHFLTLAPNTYILGQMPCLLKHVQCNLPPTDARRQEFERIAQKLGITDPNHLLLHEGKDSSSVDKDAIVTAERRKIVSIVRGASSAALRAHIRLGSFRNVVVITAALMLLLAIGVAITGLLRPTLIPMCFAPQEAGVVTIVCPTHQSQPFIPTGQPGQDGVQVADIDDMVQATAKPPDLLVVELVGLTAAAIAAAAAIRRIKGSSERYGLPVSLAALKLPTGAITAFLGLLLMRGQFVPGLSALDTSAQILAWALVFGYSQQLFTRLVDQQGQTILDNVRGADRPQPAPSSP